MDTRMITALYERLSRDDDVEGESNSMEASYPSSTTLLVVTVMPTLVEQALRRMKKNTLSKVIAVGSIAFSLFMVVGRLVSGVHWITDIIGSMLFSLGLFLIYKGLVQVFLCKEMR